MGNIAGSKADNDFTFVVGENRYDCPSPYIDGSLDGIISYLTRVHSGNVHQRGAVSIYAKTIRGSYFPWTTADFHSTLFFQSNNGPKQWLRYDFRDRRVKPSQSYSSHYFPRSWVLEGSNDELSWICLDKQRNNLTKVGTFQFRDLPNSASSAFVRRGRM
jgi:hypothetical protein